MSTSNLLCRLNLHRWASHSTFFNVTQCRKCQEWRYVPIPAQALWTLDHAEVALRSLHPSSKPDLSDPDTGLPIGSVTNVTNIRFQRDRKGPT